jgi:hypothetical protein
MQQRRKSHFDRHCKILNACRNILLRTTSELSERDRDAVGRSYLRVCLRGRHDADIAQEGDEHALPKREENDGFNTAKLPKRIDRRNLIVKRPIDLI